MQGCVVKCVVGDRNGSLVMFSLFDTENITSYICVTYTNRVKKLIDRS